MLSWNLLVCFFSLLPLSYCLSFTKQRPLQAPAEDHSPFTPSFDDEVAQLLDKWHVPGLSIAVIDGNDTFSKVTNFRKKCTSKN